MTETKTETKTAVVCTGSGWSLARLKDLLDTRSQWYYFLRWVDRVSGIQSELPEGFPSPEGQAFNAEVEVRWKKRGNVYDLLWLGTETPPDEFDFKVIEGDWESEVRNAQLYPDKETRLPKGVKKTSCNVQQRYFRDKRTSTIHFIALTEKE